MRRLVNEYSNPFGKSQNKAALDQTNENNDPNVSMANTHNLSSQLNKSQIDCEFEAAFNKLSMSNDNMQTPGKKKGSSQGS